MRIGGCLPGSEFLPIAADAPLCDILMCGDRLLIEAGFDYSETSVANVLALSEADVAQLNAAKADGTFHLECCNCFIPGDYPICAGKKRAELRAYVQKAMQRMQELGVSHVVFGSGGARAIPDGMDRAAANDEIAAFLTMCAEQSETYGVTVLIEPLNFKECNVLNTLAEAAEMVRRVGRAGVQLIADSYHMDCENESMDVLKANCAFVQHAHIADVPGRIAPGLIGADQLKAFAQTLKEVGYTGRVTAECYYQNFAEEIKIAAKFMREQF